MPHDNINRTVEKIISAVELWQNIQNLSSLAQFAQYHSKTWLLI